METCRTEKWKILCYVLTMIGRIVSQTHRQASELRKLHEALHELGPSAMVLRAIIEVDDQGSDVDKSVVHHLPPPSQTVDQTVTGHFAGDPIEKQVIQRRQEDTYWSHGRLWVKVVVGGDSRDAALATAGKRTAFDGRLGIH